MTIQRSIRAALLGGVALVSAVTALPAMAQAAWPAGQPLTLVVPYPPGGTMDFTGRLLGRELSTVLGQSVVVENRAGASGNIGTAHVAKARPDGYTLLVASTSIVIAPSTYDKLSYDVLKDLQPVSRIGFFYGALAVNPKVPVKNVPEFLAYIRDPKNEVRYGTGGVGSTAHLSGALLNRVAGGHMIHIPYKGGAPAVVDAIGGQIEAITGTPLVEVQPYIKSGQLRLLGLTSQNRSPAVPDVPTVGEHLPGYNSTQWSGVYTTAGTPADVVERLNQALNQILAKPEVKQTLLDAGIEASGDSVASFSEYNRTELDRWTGIVKDVLQN